jgi:hypothetical protein
MERPIARGWTLAASASVIGFLLVGCATNVNNPIVGIPPSVTPVGPPTSNFDSGLDAAIRAELVAANQIQSDGALPGVPVEINALTGVRALLGAEAFSSNLAMGASEIAKREGYVSALIADVQGDPYLNGIRVAGGALSATLLTMLEGVNVQLEALAAKIASDSLPDVLRSDVLSIGPSTRVLGLIQPMAHLAIAGGDELRELNDLWSKYQQLQATVAGVPNTNPNKSQEVASLSDLATVIASAKQDVVSGVAAVLSLTPSGFPSNKPTIISVRSGFIQMRTPLGKVGEAKADEGAILQLLANG